MIDLSGIQRDILYILSGMDSPNGLEVKRDLDEYYETDINPGQLYPNLDRLVDKGLVTKSRVDKRTNNYKITSRGRRAIEDRKMWEKQYLSKSKG